MAVMPAPTAATAPVAKAQAPAPSFTLLLVNDIYKMSDDKGRGGFARAAGIARAERAKGVPVLFCHAGDCYSPSLMSGFDQGAHIVAMQNKMGLDVFVPGNHEFDFGKGAAMIAAYQQVRPLNPAERAALPLLARGSALRFLLTRLVDWLNVPPGAVVTPKDPLEYLKKLRFHQKVASPTEYGLA